MASTVANEPLVREHERIVGELNGRHFLGTYHHLERFNPLTNRRGNRRVGGRGRPYSEPNRDQSGAKSKQGGLAHLRPPVHHAQDGCSSHLMVRNMPGTCFGRCDGHHEMDVSGSEKVLVMPTVGFIAIAAAYRRAALMRAAVSSATAAVTCRHRQGAHSNCQLPRYYHQNQPLPARAVRLTRRPSCPWSWSENWAQSHRAANPIPLGLRVRLR